jgi:hypothetical protein
MTMAAFVKAFIYVAILLPAAAAQASQERHLSWSEVRIVSPGADDSGHISFVATLADGERWNTVEVEAFGRKYALDEKQRSVLAGCPARSLVITYEPGYKEHGGHTVHFKFKKSSRIGEKLTTREVTVSISHDNGLEIQERLEAPAEK